MNARKLSAHCVFADQLGQFPRIGFEWENEAVRAEKERFLLFAVPAHARDGAVSPVDCTRLIEAESDAVGVEKWPFEWAVVALHAAT
ncbi:hypothetical protein D3C85_1277040 [compost metagenome]